jgi:co-chaperonin GroES (HSP10)
LLAKQFDADKIGELFVPNEAKRVSLRATVVAVGPLCVDTKVGDRIIFGRYAKFDVPLRGKKWRDHFIMNEDDILCKIKTGV